MSLRTFEIEYLLIEYLFTVRDYYSNTSNDHNASSDFTTKFYRYASVLSEIFFKYHLLMFEKRGVPPDTDTQNLVPCH